MVDKENQWEDLEYSEDNMEKIDGASTMSDEDNYASEEYSDDGYEEEYSDDESEIYNTPKKKNNGAVLLILLLIIGLLGAGVFFVMSKNNNNSADIPANNQQTAEAPNNPASPENPDNNDMADMFFEQANGNGSDMVSVDFNNQDGSANVTTQGNNGEIVANVTDQPPENINNSQNIMNEQPQDNQNNNDMLSNNNLSIPEPNNTIMVSYNPTARQNPFKPPVLNPKDDETYKQINNTEFEVIEPPVTSVEDENLTKLLQTQISGILYDDDSPSAIVNLNGMDQFVKIGDTIAGYKIQNITKDKVQISYKNNSYVASVGELFVRGTLDKQRAVANLENKFAGRYKSNNN